MTAIIWLASCCLIICCALRCTILLTSTLLLNNSSTRPFILASAAMVLHLACCLVLQHPPPRHCLDPTKGVIAHDHEHSKIPLLSFLVSVFCLLRVFASTLLFLPPLLLWCFTWHVARSCNVNHDTTQPMTEIFPGFNAHNHAHDKDTISVHSGFSLVSAS